MFLEKCYALLLFALLFAAEAQERKIQLASLKTPILVAHVNGKEAPVPAGASLTAVQDGLLMKFVFPSPGHDACLFEFPVNESKFTIVSVSVTAKQPGHRKFVVLTDQNGEMHYFSLPSKSIAGQIIKRAGKLVLTIPIRIQNDHPGEYYAWRWGGDDSPNHPGQFLPQERKRDIPLAQNGRNVDPFGERHRSPVAGAA